MAVSQQPAKSHIKSYRKIAAYKREYDLFKGFEEISGIRVDTRKAFLVIFVVVRYFGMRKLVDECPPFTNELNHLQNLLAQESNEIGDLIQMMELEKFYGGFAAASMNEVYTYIQIYIDSITITGNYIYSYPFVVWLDSVINEEQSNWILNRIEAIYKYLHMFKLETTDALLLITDMNSAKLAEDLVGTYLKNNIDKINVISYAKQIFGNETLDRIIANEDYAGLTQDRLFYEERPSANFRYLESVIHSMEKDTFVLIVGIDKLLSPTHNNAVGTTLFQNGILNLHTSQSLQWNKFVKKLDGLYVLANEKRIMLTIMYALDDTTNPVNQITQAADQYDSFNIICFAPMEDSTIIAVMNAIENYGTGMLDEQGFEQIINQYRDELGEDNYHFSYGIKCMQNNDYISALEYFELCSEALPPANKLIIANLYTNLKRYKDAYLLLKEIYEADNYTINLMPAILEAVVHLDNDALIEEWLYKAHAVNVEDPQTIQYAANFYTNNHRYKESADKWKELYRLTDQINFKLLYEINMMLDNLKSYNESKIVETLLPYAETYPDMKNEVLFRIGKLCYEHKGNLKKGWQYFSQIDRNINTPYAYAAAIQRLIIGQEIIAEAAARRSSEQELLQKQQGYIDELLSDIGILTYTEQGNFSWSKHIKESFHDEVWKKYLLQIVLAKIEQWSKMDAAFFEKTHLQINLDENFADNIVSTDEQNYLVLTRFSDQLQLLYFESLSSINAGEFQLANDTIFTLFRDAKIANNDQDKYLAIMLGLLAWSRSNAAMGEEVESILAAIAAIDLAIQCEEAVAYFYGFPSIMDFLYNNVQNIKLEATHNAALNTLVQYQNDRIILLKNNFIQGSYENIIEQFQSNKLSWIWKQAPETEVLINANEQENEFADEVKIVIESYFNLGMRQQACEHIIRLMNSVKINLHDNHIAVVCKLYQDWANKLLMHKDYVHAVVLIEEAITIIDKIRTVNYKRERSLLGRQANTIYRTYLEIVGRYATERAGGINLLDTKITRDVLVNLAPRSIIEQKHFNNNEALTDEKNEALIKASDEYYELFNVLNKMHQQGKTDGEYSNLLEKFSRQKSYLETHHPSFKPLPSYGKMIKEMSDDQYNVIRMKLNDDELVFQIVMINNLLISNVISKDSNEINVTVIETSDYYERFEEFKQYIGFTDYELLQKECNETFVQLTESISGVLIQPLYRFIDENKYKKLYFMSDLNLTYVTMNFMRYKNQWLIHYFDRIENIFDFSIVGSDNNIDYGGKVFAHFVNKQDSSVSKIVNMVNKKPHVEMLEAKDDFVETTQDLKTLILVGHGISEINGFNYIGAKEIKKSRKRTIHLATYLQVGGRIQNAMIISCSGGTLTNEYAELNNGVWSSLLEKNIAYILYCKWDVSIEYTNKLMELILRLMNENDQISLSEALIRAQRQWSKVHPILWAGLEVWKNE